MRPFEVGDTEEVVALWDRCGLLRPWNDPRKDIERKLTVQPELFFVAESDGVVATAMAGYDGHRGWLYYVAVAPERRGEGIGRDIVAHSESALTNLGCPKINVQIRSGNDAVQSFWSGLGFEPDQATGMGKRLIPD
ncbi:GNAT family acetyltransferase [Amnibacterium flavum]|uniref:GNAT family acetyltransferase n=1 Tax=Amnibacterium flavum TaxID=2173173 RepID=A0A2V1HVB4_9MICO|nr:GNAT family acetyltransferase [Amnibacterium flavum]